MDLIVYKLNFLTVHSELEEILLFSGPTMAELLCSLSCRYLWRNIASSLYLAQQHM